MGKRAQGPSPIPQRLGNSWMARNPVFPNLKIEIWDTRTHTHTHTQNWHYPTEREKP